ncbi:MAG: hypothetical protein Q3966_08890 [Neisseria sp.]|nr:hypothetical protein [Neisseria sp.]
MFQHTGPHIRRSIMYYPDFKGVTPLPNKPKSYRPKGRGFNH